MTNNELFKLVLFQSISILIMRKTAFTIIGDCIYIPEIAIIGKLAIVLLCLFVPMLLNPDVSWCKLIKKTIH